MRRGTHAPDSARQHRDWLGLVDVTGPFLSLPVLRATWPTLDPLDKAQRERLRQEHGTWQADRDAGQAAWVDYVLRDLLGWGDALQIDGLDALTVLVTEHDTAVAPTFALVEPERDVKPDTVRLLGLVCDGPPTSRVPESQWSATPVDRLAHLCRQHDVQLGLATDGRWWALVWAPRSGVTATAVFDALSWPESGDRDVVRAFASILSRTRFFGVPEDERLPKLLERSKDSQEDITDALGVRVRQAVELLVSAFGRSGEVRKVDAHEVYRGAVTVMMRVVFLLFAEERGLLPADNELYARAYSAGGMREELEQRAREGSEVALEHTRVGWHRLLALFDAVCHGVSHPRLTMHPHDGSLFDPEAFAWLPLTIDDRTVLHMLRAVQRVEVGTGKNRESRSVSFRTLDVEQIGYVYEGLLSFDGLRADGVYVGLVGGEGREEEVRLADLEAIAAGAANVPALAAAIADRYKDSKIGSATVLEKRLALLAGVEREEERKRLLAVNGKDYALSERLLPFAGIIRTDLRGLPVVILPGALYVTESALRKNTGTHYTPRFLAEQVVEGTLEPLVYDTGPLQTADKSKWKPKSSKDILALKVADIAMGSAAFLVAAARYLGDRLVEAWSREGNAKARDYLASRGDAVLDADEDPVVIDARRHVIEHCLYGADINPMAVEMAKLSLWLVSMDRERPFTFLDDRLVAGDSLLGIMSMDQLEYMHMDPVKGRALHEGVLFDISAVRALVTEVAEDRRRITEIELGDDPIAALDAKRELLASAEQKTKQARLIADVAVGAAVAHAGRGDRGLHAASIAAAQQASKIVDGVPHAEDEAREVADRWLATDQIAGGFDRDPIHWPLVFPEVFENDGFDAVIGNPPFLGGQKLTGSLGTAYREYLVHGIGQGARGSADLVAYFLLRAHGVLNGGGQTGLIATNTLAQGDTREVGLDQIDAAGVTIRQAIKSRPWPSKSAALEFCAVWTSRATVDASVPRMCDDVSASGITTSLEPASRVTGIPQRFAASGELSYIGSYVLGMGFTMEPGQAAALIERNPRNAEILFPYLNGQDLNSRSDMSGSRWVINFHDWTEDRAREYPEAYDQVVRLVKPEREKVKFSKSAREKWWCYERTRPELYEATAALGRVVVIARVSKTVMPVMVPTGQVFSEMIVVFATDDPAVLALLSSAPHYWWAVARASSMKADLRYTPSDVFETLALPELTQEMRDLGGQLDTFRREIMLGRQLGLTKLYNEVFSPANTDDDIVELRRIHQAIDEATVRAYAWDNLLDKLDHGFHPAGRGLRFTIGSAAQREILDRLLELNQTRYADEAARGLRDKKGKKAAKSQPVAEQGTLGF